MNRKSENLGIAAVVVLVIGLLAFQFLGGVESSEPVVSAEERVATEQRLEDLGQGEAQRDEIEATEVSQTRIVYDSTIDVFDLPPEAIDTLVLIDSDGPYPYRKDGSTFQNREGLLPDHPRGYYREFTVETPGSPDRGARRIVAGDDGELYWTSDHYDSFAQIVGW